MGGKNPHEGCAALVLNRYRQRRAGATRRQAGVLAATTSIAPRNDRCRVSSPRALRSSAGYVFPAIIARIVDVAHTAAGLVGRSSCW
jgi:hypothetical protein